MPSTINQTNNYHIELSTVTVGDFLNAIQNSEIHIPQQMRGLVLTLEYLEGGNFSDNTALFLASKQVVSCANQIMEQISPLLGRLIATKYFSFPPLTNAAVAKQLEVNEPKFYRLQKVAIAKLTNLINEQEKCIRSKHLQEMLYRLDSKVDAQNMIRREGISHTLANGILKPDGLPVFVVSGIGGIGKSTLVEQGLTQVINTFAFNRFVRINTVNGSLRKESFLRQAYDQLMHQTGKELSLNEIEHQVLNILKTLPCLIFIDGIEQNLEDLITLIFRFVVPSKFVVTSREEPTATSSKMRHVQVPELSLKEVNELIQSEIARLQSGLEVAAFADEELNRLYGLVGGNPLVIKLVVSLSSEMSRDEIFEDLARLTHSDTVYMYMQIYWVLWKKLSGKSHHLLMALGLIDNTTLTQINIDWMLKKLGTPLTKSNMRQAIRELKICSLLTVSLDETYPNIKYEIHSLTKLFIREQIYKKPTFIEGGGT